MTISQSRSCDEFQMAAMARLDGESAPLTDDEINSHIVNCDVCRVAVAGLDSIKSAMRQVDYGRPGVDLWPGIRASVSPAPKPRAGGDMTMIVGLSMVLGAWRLTQLLFDLPVPVVNSTVPLALVVLVLWRVVGDPFAIQVSQRLHGDRS